MKQAGVLGTLDQTFNCPDLVKEALCDAAMLQKSVRQRFLDFTISLIDCCQRLRQR